MMIHQTVTVMAVLGAHKQKGESALKFAVLMLFQTRSLHFTFLTCHIFHLLQRKIFFQK